MATLRELELKCRGAQDIAEAWNENHVEVRQVWRIEDLLAELLSCFEVLEYMQKHYERFGSLPSDADYHHFVNVLRIYRLAAKLACELADQYTEYEIDHLDKLKQSTTFVHAVITNNERSEPVQHALDLVDSMLNDQDMTPDESKEFKKALERRPSDIEVFPVAETTD